MLFRSEEEMPPEDKLQPSQNERILLLNWIDQALEMARKRVRPKNGIIRRLTVAQYRNTIRDLLGIKEDLTGVLPPDAVSIDGFFVSRRRRGVGSVRRRRPVRVRAVSNIQSK